MTLSKCTGTACEKSSKCLRYTIEALQRYQPWICMETSIKDPKVCKFFINNEEKENVSS